MTSPYLSYDPYASAKPKQRRAQSARIGAPRKFESLCLTSCRIGVSWPPNPSEANESRGVARNDAHADYLDV